MDQPPPPPQPVKRLTLKLSGIGTSSMSATTVSAFTPGGSTSTAMSPPPATPSVSTPSGGAKKIKISLKKSQPPTPADGIAPTLPSINTASIIATPSAAVPTMPKTQSGRQPKPSAKKRSHAESDDDVPLANGRTIDTKPKKPKITLKQSTSTVKTPILKVKQTGKIPHRPLGEGYDSEAEDRELDPVIEEQFLLRMMPGEHCEYLRWAINEKKIGISKAQGGADVTMKFLDEEGRRAMFTIKGQPYAAILLDLPTITEGMKTWDKKAMVKSADICQMMLVFAKVRNEEEARTVLLPRAVEHGHRWPHGITPPMHDARNRRFRKRLSKLEIQNKEAEVERLLAADKEAKSTRYEFIDDRTQIEEVESGEEYEGEEEDADADGEADDYFGDAQPDQQMDASMFEVDDALLEAEFMDAVETPGGAEDLATPAVGVDAVTPATANTGTPAAQTEESGTEANGADEESDDDEDMDDDDDDGDDVDDGGDEERHDEVAGVKAEIATLKKQLAMYEDQLAQSRVPFIRKRIEASIKNVKSEIKLKQSAIGEVDED